MRGLVSIEFLLSLPLQKGITVVCLFGYKRNLASSTKYNIGIFP